MSRGVVVHWSNYKDAYEWCVRTYQPATIEKRKWFVDVQPLMDPEFVFQNDSDAELFMLRWL